MKRFTWSCGCSLVTEPLSFHRWCPCPKHSELPMSEVVTQILESKLPEVKELEKTEAVMEEL